MNRIIIKSKNEVFYATVNETIAAKEFLSRLPFSVTVSKGSISLAGYIVCGRFDPSDTTISCKTGEIGYLSGKLSFYIKEDIDNGYEGYKMIIGCVEKEYISVLNRLPGKAKLIIEKY